MSLTPTSSGTNWTSFDHIKIGDIIIFDDLFYEVLEIVRSNSGKHGISKILFKLLNLLTKKIESQLVSANTPIEVVTKRKNTYMIKSIEDDGSMICVNNHDEPITHIKLPEQFKEKIKTGYKIITLHMGQKETIIDWSVF